MATRRRTDVATDEQTRNSVSASSSKRQSSYNRAQVIFLFASTAIIITCVKFMLIPAYYSTDFEVHRNWMAITSKLPLVKWYTENTSQWTLDYPPFFAYFELLLSYFAPYFDPQMLQITAQPYTSPQAVFYQRLTVIISDLVYFYAVYVWIGLLTDPKKQSSHGLALRALPPSTAEADQWTSSSFLYIFLFLCNVGHLIVDHIHFQYNGLLSGLLLLSMARMVNEQIYWSAFWFAVLLNFKHIYLYMAPAYFVFLLVEHCITIDRKNFLRSQLHLGSLTTIGAIVVAVFALSFGPFIAKGQLGNLLARLFPFQRGLSHAYWAPNFWALYNGADLVLAKLLRRGGGGGSGASTITSGLVQQSVHAVLPSISPKISLALVVMVIVAISVIFIRNRSHTGPSSARIRRRRSVVFIELVLLSTLTFFTFGYHVHEKAILLVIPPMIPLVLANANYARLFFLLSTTGYFSLFPLLYREAETPIKLLLLALHVTFTATSFAAHYPSGRSNTKLPVFPLLNQPEMTYLLGLIPLQLFSSLGPHLAPAFFSRYQFLPLMATSLYCTLGVLYTFVELFRQMCTSEGQLPSSSSSSTSSKKPAK